MPLTRNFRETVLQRAQQDAEFRVGLLREATECIIAGEPEAGKSLLRDYINATLGFDALGMAVGKSPKSIMRMFGPKGNPTSANLSNILACLQKQEGVRLSVRTQRR